MSNKSTYWVIFELIWRDFFRFFSIKHGDNIFYKSGTIGRAMPWTRDPVVFQKWVDGQTGWPLVSSANMGTYSFRESCTIFEFHLDDSLVLRMHVIRVRWMPTCVS